MNPLEIPAEKRARVSRWDALASAGWERLRLSVEHRLFAISFGVVAPLTGLLLDPGLFDAVYGHGGWLSRFHPGVYPFAAIEMLALLVWLVRRGPNSVAAGVFAAGALFSALVAIVLLPLAAWLAYLIVGSCFEFEPSTRWVQTQAFGIGFCVLGLSPWLTTLVYANAAKRALAVVDGSAHSSRVAFASAACGMLALIWLASPAKH